MSYILHYIKSDKVPSWIRRVQDNAGSTNKNQYVIGAAMEIVQQNLLSLFRISFMVVGHTKFDPDRLFSLGHLIEPTHLTSVNSLSSFHNMQLSLLMMAKLVRAWRSLLPDKYSNCPGIRNLHDFLVVKHPTTGIALMKVRKFCHEGKWHYEKE